MVKINKVDKKETAYIGLVCVLLLVVVILGSAVSFLSSPTAQFYKGAIVQLESKSNSNNGTNGTNQYHKGCLGKMCTNLPYPGVDTCNSHSDCLNNTGHSECILLSCEWMPIEGNNNCESNSDCSNNTGHYQCHNKECQWFPTSGKDFCDDDKDCEGGGVNLNYNSIYAFTTITSQGLINKVDTTFDIIRDTNTK